MKYQLIKDDQNLLIRTLLFVITLNYDDSNIESCWVTSDARHPRVCTRNMTENVPFVSFCPFFFLVRPFWPVFGLSNTLYYLTICEIEVISVQPWNCQQFLEHDLQETLQKLSHFIMRGEVPCQIS